MEKLSRRGFLGAGIAAGVVSMLRVNTAYAAQSVNCPIYMFHETGGAAVEKVVRANFGRIPVTVGELGAIIRAEAPIPGNPLVCFTFDDGYKIQFDQALPILNRYQVGATFFVIGGLMNEAWKGDGVHTYMNPSQIQHLSNLGYEIGSHTVTHSSLPIVRSRDEGSYWDEISKSKDELEDVIDSSVDSFAYPNGSYTVAIAQDVMGLYTAAVSTAPGTLQTPNSLSGLRRTRA